MERLAHSADLVKGAHTHAASHLTTSMCSPSSLCVCERRYGAGLSLRLDWAWFEPRSLDKTGLWDKDLRKYLNYKHPIPDSLQHHRTIPIGVICEFGKWSADKGKQCQGVFDGSKGEHWIRVEAADGEVKFCCKQCYLASSRSCCSKGFYRVYGTQCPNCLDDYPVGSAPGAGSRGQVGDCKWGIGSKCAFSAWGADRCLGERKDEHTKFVTGLIDGVEQPCCKPCYDKSAKKCHGWRWYRVATGFVCPECGKEYPLGQK